MNRFLTLLAVLLPFSCVGAPSISYTSYFHNIVVNTNITLGGVARSTWPAEATAGTVINTGASTVGAVPAYTDLTGTNVAPTSVTISGSSITAGASTFTGAVGFADGTAAAPSIGWTSDQDGSGTGFYRNSADQVGVAINGLAKYSFASSVFNLPANINLSFGGSALLYGLTGNIFQIGANSATATASTLKGPDGSGTDKVGGALQLGGGKSTGTAAGGAIILHTANSAGDSASSLNTFSERFHAIPKWVTLTSATATTLFTIPVPATNYVGLTATVTIYATDGTDHQSKTSVITVDAIAKTTTITPTISQADNTTAASAGTLTCTFTAVDNTSNVLAVKATADSSLTETVLRAKIVITAINSNGSGAVTEF